jgi:hypothetical protein
MRLGGLPCLWIAISAMVWLFRKLGLGDVKSDDRTAATAAAA